MSDAFGVFRVQRRESGSGNDFVTISPPSGLPPYSRSFDDSSTPPPAGFDYRLLQTTTGGVVVPYNDVQVSQPGKLLWVSSIDSLSGNSTRSPVTGAATDATGNSYICGYFVDPSAFVAKYDKNGNQQWIKRLTTYRVSDGQVAVVQTYGLRLSPNGEIIVGGYFFGRMDLGNGVILDAPPDSFDRSFSQAFVASFNASTGVTNWAKAFGDPSSPETMQYISVDTSSNIYVIGQFQSTFTVDSVTITGNTRPSSFVVKISGSTHLALWGKSILAIVNSGTVSPSSIASDSTDAVWVLVGAKGAAQTSDGTNLSAYPTGDGDASLTVIKYSSAGTETIAKPIASLAGGDAHVGSTVRLSDNALFITSGTRSSTINGSSLICPPGESPPCLFLMALNPDGTTLMANGYGNNAGNAINNGEAVALTSDSGRIVFGGTADTASSFGNPSGVVLIGNANPDQMFIAGYNITGAGALTYRWAYRINNPGSQSYISAAATSLNQFAIVGGGYLGRCDFGGTILDAGFRWKAYIACYVI